MYLAFALDYIPRRMRELGYGENYVTRYRHLYVADKTVMKIDADNQLWMFIEPEAVVTISSERGVYDMYDTTINQQQHEHSGKIKVSNNSGRDVYVLFIQAIPTNKNNRKK